MRIDPEVLRILDSIQEGKPLTKAACVSLLRLSETSLEASLLRGVADACSRQRFSNTGVILGQIGIEIAACPGKCGFCGFAEGHTSFSPETMPLDTVLRNAAGFTKSQELYALFLLTMHTFDFAHLVQTIEHVRESIPKETQIVLNIGDFDRAQAQALKAAGADGAYHICRLGEGIDTAIAPEQRKATIRNIKESGMDWYYCCEPIGPEHAPEELAEQIFLGIEYGCTQHAAMRRVYLPASPLATRGQITELRLAQVAAVVALASLQCPDTQSIAVHEPNLAGLISGANALYAETGANPRDMNKDTARSRGRDIADCKKMLYEAGFNRLCTAPGKHVSLQDAYREQTSAM